MAVPQNLLDALTGLQSDQDDVHDKQSSKDASAQALAQAQAADSNAAHDLLASQAKLAADLKAFEGQIETTYGAS